MMNKTNTQTIETFTVLRDGELATDYMPVEPSTIEVALSNVQASLSRFTGNIALQTRMAVFDSLHQTNYRQIRNELVEQKRRQEFEKSIGLVAIGKK